MNIDFKRIAPVPSDIIKKDLSVPRTLINWLKNKRTVAVAAFPDETYSDDTKNKRGYGLDCNCHGTGWIHGQVMCGRHVPMKPFNYYLPKV
jgi:hypothetical protein